MFAIAKSVGFAAVAATSMNVAVAAPTFTVDPSVFGAPLVPGLGAAPFQADAMGTSGNTRATLSAAFGSAAGSVTGVGYLSFDTFKLNGNTVGVGTSGLGINYRFWAEFSFTMNLVAGTLGNVGSDYILTSTTLTMYGEQLDCFGPCAADSTFNSGNTAVNPTVAHSADTLTLGTGTLLFGAAGINLAGGSSFNPTMLFSLVAPNGPNFFTAPDPFFPLAFASQTNDAAQITRNLGTKEMHLATGGTAAFANRVPEPMTLALVGLALVGAGVASRRQLRK